MTRKLWSKLELCQNVRAMGDLEIGVKGGNSDAPVIYKHSPITVSVRTDAFSAAC